MSKFINVVVRERMEGTPGFVEEQEFDIYINPDNITLFNQGEDPDVVFVRMVCGATLCVVMTQKEFVSEMVRAGCQFIDKLPSKRSTTKKKVTTKKKATKK